MSGALLLVGALALPHAHGRRASEDNPADAVPPMPDAATDLRSGTCTPGPGYVDRGDDYIERLLRSEPERFAEILDNAESLRAQILVSEVVRDVDGRPCIRSYGYRLNAEYFYPASAIKTVAATASLLTFQAHDAPELVTGPLYVRPRTAHLITGEDAQTSVGRSSTTLAGEVERTLIVSSNRGFNVLFDIAGMEQLNRMMWQAGLRSVRMQHRLEQGDLHMDAHRFAPEVRVGRGRAARVVAPERTAGVRFRNALMLDMPRTGVGDAHIDSDTRQRVNHPLDFRRKNYISLRDLQRIVLEVVDPTLDGSDVDLPLSDANRALLRDIMSRRPPPARRGTVDDAEARFEPLIPGINRVLPRESYEYVNKAGRAWGFHLESAYVHRLGTERAFFVATTLYVDRDGLMNDNRADYDRVSFPFMVNLGEVLARELLQ
ncbi:MAG: serine hydrolase [Myxococcales bacterium]|nr:serine hydrolase [Myxococcales bacterium]MCB9630198.1 serine hydrolase [Sandaracinaceae bacterium]